MKCLTVALIEGETHCTTTILQDAKVEEFVPLPTVEPFSTVQVNTDTAQSFVAQTLGKRRRPSDEVDVCVCVCVCVYV